MCLLFRLRKFLPLLDEKIQRVHKRKCKKKVPKNRRRTCGSSPNGMKTFWYTFSGQMLVNKSGWWLRAGWWFWDEMKSVVCMLFKKLRLSGWWGRSSRRRRRRRRRSTDDEEGTGGFSEKEKKKTMEWTEYVITWQSDNNVMADLKKLNNEEKEECWESEELIFLCWSCQNQRRTTTPAN